METPTETKRYLWQKEIITFIESDGTQTPQETVFLLAVYGKTGNGISSTEIQYKAWTNGTTIPTGEWLDNPPEVEPGNYLWTRIRITYTDNSTPSDSYSITYIGKDGEGGADGISVKSLTEYYAISASQPAINSALWNTSIPAYVSGLSYWKKTVTVWSDESKADTVVIIKDEALTAANATAESAKESVDNIQVGGTNLIYNSGVFYDDLYPWISNETDGVLMAGETGGSKILMPTGSIAQSISYQLKWDTEYVYHTYVQFTTNGTATVTQPLSYHIWGANAITNDRPAEYEEVIANIKVYVDDIENGNITANEWHHIELKLKTKQRSETTSDFIMFKPIFDGETFVTGQSYYVRWIKLEEGNKATDWSAAPDEINIIINKIDQTAKDAQNTAEEAKDTADEAKDTADEVSKGHAQLEQTVVDNLAAAIKEIYMEYCQKDYVWTKIPANTETQTYQSGIVYYSQNIDEETGNISYIKIRPTLNENGTFTFDVYTKEAPSAPTNSDTWSRIRPQWVDGKAIYQRTVILYNNNKTNESTPYMIEDYQTIDDLRYQDALSILTEMRGTNNIFYNSDGLFIYDGGTKENSTHAIIMNNSGILFQHRATIEDEWDPASSVWTIEGHFDAKDILVSNLTAESIVDGTLTLGSQSKDGELLIKDDQQDSRAELSSQRSIWYLNDESAVIIGKDCGFQVVASNGIPKFGNSLVWTFVSSGTYENNVNYYTEEGNLLSLIPEWTKNDDETLTLIQGQAIPSSGVYTVSYLKTFEVAEQKITETVNFGDVLQTVNINTTDAAGLVHRGIGFVPVSKV